MSRQGAQGFELESRWIGGLPLINALLARLGIDALLARVVPAPAARTTVPPAHALGVLLRNIVLCARRPLYTQAEWARRAVPALLGLTPAQATALNDDRIGRALEQLFQADRAALLTDLVLRAIREFQIELGQLHNDSTTITFTGAYAAAEGRTVHGQPTVHITYGHNKDHRPDLKQLLFVLTVAADGAVPIHYRALDGNTNDAPTHIQTWETLCTLAGRRDFLYVADSKLCAEESLTHIAQHQGRFITVLPRTRREDRWFRELLQTHQLPWEEVLRRPNPRRRAGREDVWKVVEAPLPSKEGYRVIWVWNSLMAAQDAEARQARIERAWAGMQRLTTKLEGPRCRIRTRERVEALATRIVATAARWVAYAIHEHTEPHFRQESRGRPGHTTRYLRGERVRFSIALTTRPEVIEADARCDGLFPLITNCPELSKKQILEAYKYQPRLEKRLEQLKTVEAVTPVFLKRVSRIEALLFLYFIALLVQALLEREVRRAMARETIDRLPLYPEERECRAPSTERILDLFASLQRHRLWQQGHLVQVFDPELTELQRTILRLLGISPAVFTATA
jgi:transposase